MNLADKLNKLKPWDYLPPGEVSRELKKLPLDERKLVLNAAFEVLDEEERGPKHGLGREFILTQHLANTPAMNRLVDHVEIDMVTNALINKRGSDADLPIPEPDRRDFIRAAIDAHGGTENE